MTLAEAIAAADSICHNEFDTAVKAQIVSTLDGRLINDVLKNYKGVEYPDNFKGYKVESDSTKELVAKFPFDEMYPHYLAAQIYLRLHDQKYYNSELEVFNSIFEDYKIHIARAYQSAGTTKFRVR